MSAESKETGSLEKQGPGSAERGSVERDSNAAAEDVDDTPYGVRYIQATVTAFRKWDRTLLFASLFLVACEWC